MLAVPTSEPNYCPVSYPALSSQSMQSHEKAPTSHRTVGQTLTIGLALGANRQGQERVQCKASWIQSSRIGSALVCVCRNAQHPELRLPESPSFVLIAIAMVATSPNGHIGCLVSPPPLPSQNIQSHENSPTSYTAQGKTQSMSLALSANREDK